jgi:uncharacterized membrane-anchored protein
MEPVGRRNFAASLGLLGLIGVGVKGYQEVKERIVYKQDELPTKELEKQLEGKPVLQLMATYGTPKPKPAYNMNQYYFVNGSGQDYVEGTKKEVSVQIVPGPDGKLYVKENDTWRRM